MRNQFLGVFFLISACGLSPASQQPEVLSARIAADSSFSLCSAYRNPSTTPRGKLMIEAELAVRGVNQCSGASYGGPSAAALGSNLYDRQESLSSMAPVNTRNCSDFSSGATAQKFFLATGGPLNDGNDLDRDGDGLACEYGSQIRRIAAYRPPSPRVVRPRYSRSTCYTGPRGGTYTLTRSGNKNYDGC